MAKRGTRLEKVKRIFTQFDGNGDGGLNRGEMSALVVAVNPRVKFSDEQINAILDEVFRTYGEFIDGERGLTCDGLIRTYDDGAGDVDRDFDALRLELTPDETETETKSNFISSEASSSSMAVDSHPNRGRNSDASPNLGIAFESTWKLVEDLELMIKKLKSKQVKDGKIQAENFDVYSDPGWSRDLVTSSEIFERRIFWDETGNDYGSFVKEIRTLRTRADGGGRSREEAMDAHIAIGTVLYEQQLFKEALSSFNRACDLQPEDVRSHFRAGSCFYILGDHGSAKKEFESAMEAAENGGNRWNHLLPQIHVNLGITLEAEGLLLNACDHYREAAIFFPAHFRALKLLGSALLAVAEHGPAIEALEEAARMKTDYADAHCDLGSALHAAGGDEERAIAEFQKAIDLRPDHVDALYNLGGLYMDMGRYQRSTEMYTRVLTVRPNHWRAQVNRAVSLLGAGEVDDARKSLKEALRTTNRVELYDAVSHLRKKKAEPVDPPFAVVDRSMFRTHGLRTSTREQLADALRVRAFQRLTRLGSSSAGRLRTEIAGADPETSVRKARLELVLRRLLHFLKPETFQGAMKEVNRTVLSVLAGDDSRVDLATFLAVLAPVCGGRPEERKQVTFDALCRRSAGDGDSPSSIGTPVALRYFDLLHRVYLGRTRGGDTDEGSPAVVTRTDFLRMFDDPERGFGILSAVVKLESSDRNRGSRHVCSVCRYPITGPRFKEVKSRFSLCGSCYSEGKVPADGGKPEEFTFKEYGTEAEAVREKCLCFNLTHSKTPYDS